MLPQNNSSQMIVRPVTRLAWSYVKPGRDPPEDAPVHREVLHRSVGFNAVVLSIRLKETSKQLILGRSSLHGMEKSEEVKHQTAESNKYC